MTQPVRSMTGAGSHVAESGVGRFEIEVRSVNNRFLKTSVRSYGAMPSPEALVEGRIRKRIGRGHVSMTIRYRPPAEQALAQRIDQDAFRAVAERLRKLAKDAGLPPVKVGDVIAVAQGIGDGSRHWDEATQGAALTAAVEAAIDALITAREAEGARMAAELERVLDSVQEHVQAVGARADEVPKAVRARLETRLAELLEGSGAPVDPQWLAREVAVMADKADVTEELARLQAHVEEFRSLLTKGGVVGRRLDFLVQELGRETNTVGSKANRLELTRVVMDLKTDVERLREQVQNLE